MSVIQLFVVQPNPDKDVVLKNDNHLTATWFTQPSLCSLSTDDTVLETKLCAWYNIA